jgi:putative tryptophan/tyrosine transport system substrate-binding protein
MIRREFITLLGGAVAAWPLAASAQQNRKIPRVGVLWHAGSAEQEGANFTSLVKGFQDLGYTDGKNVRLDHRFPNEQPDRFKSMVAELASTTDILIVVGNNAAPYAIDAAGKIPVVAIHVSDPVGMGLVENLPRPGGNITGVSNQSTEMVGKRLQLLKEIVPGVSRIAVSVNPDARISPFHIKQTRDAAANLGLDIHTFEWRNLAQLEQAFDAMVSQSMQALVTNPDGLAFTHRESIAKLAIKNHLPLASWSRVTLTAGALMSYGVDDDAISRRAAVYVDKILKGARPAELPVEQPTKFVFLINIGTAKALGMEIPETLLARADEVID